jgi:hypothetical protein
MVAFSRLGPNARVLPLKGKAAKPRATAAAATSAHPVKRKDPLTPPVNGPSMWAALDQNRVT